MKIFNKKWKNILRKDWPMVGEIYICMDSQERLGFPTYLVSRMGDGTLEGDTVQLGLFWEPDMAMSFAAVVNQLRASV